MQNSKNKEYKSQSDVAPTSSGTVDSISLESEECLVERRSAFDVGSRDQGKNISKGVRKW